VILIAS